MYNSSRPGGRIAVLTDGDLNQEFDPEVLAKKQYNKLVHDSGVLREITSEVCCNVSHFTSFKEFDSLLTSLSRNKSAVEPEFQDWMTEFQEKCKSREEDGKLTIEFKELVRITGVRN